MKGESVGLQVNLNVGGLRTCAVVVLIPVMSHSNILYFSDLIPTETSQLQAIAPVAQQGLGMIFLCSCSLSFVLLKLDFPDFLP